MVRHSLTCLALGLVVTAAPASAAGAEARPFIYGCGITWGAWLGLAPERAMAWDRLCMDRIKAMGGTNVPANFAWVDIEPQPGERHWEYVDHQVKEARKRGLEVFAYTGLTPDWALPPEAPNTPGIGYRFPPDERFAGQFEAFFAELARRYRGRVKYYEFWNEPNGCSWINDGGSNGHMAHTYVPWLKRWYRAMKAGDPGCVLAVGGLDYHAGVKEGWRYLEDIYANGGGASFDAVAIHPYGDPLHWKAIDDTYACLVRHGDGHKKLWLNEYGWNTRDEGQKARNLRKVLRRLATPRYHMVEQANYLVITDLPTADDRTGHDYGLCGRDRESLGITPRASYEAFRELRKGAVSPTPVAAPVRGEVPAGFMLSFTAPGCNPGEPGDDQGPEWSLRRAAMRASGCNTGGFGIHWGDTEREDTGEGPARFDFGRVRPDPEELAQPNLVVYLDFLGNPWAERFRFSDRERYNRLLERWAEAACRFARERYGATLFETGGNERDLVAPETYRPHFADWHYYYMDPIRAVHAGMKAAHPENRLIIGNLCYSDRDHIGALYCAGAKGNFEVLAIHAYGPREAHVDMEQIIESHQEMVYRGDPDIPIILNEGWSCFPLPDSVDKDPVWRGGSRPYTPQEVEHYRQCVLDGWRNLTTARPGVYDPAWVAGARFFVLNDHWGGRGWAARGKAVYGEDGALRGFSLDGYFIGTSDPDYLKPYLRPWGLMDIEGRPKGDTLAAFPPAAPEVVVEAELEGDLEEVGTDPRRPEVTSPVVCCGRTYRARCTVTNRGAVAVEQLQMVAGDRETRETPGGYAFGFDGGRLRVMARPGADPLVRLRLAEGRLPRRLAPGEAARLGFEVEFSERLLERRDDGKMQRVRPCVDVYFVMGGRPYHVDGWLPRLAVVR